MNGSIAPFYDDAFVSSSKYYSAPNSLHFPQNGTYGPEDIVLMFDTTLNITTNTLPLLATPYVTGELTFSQMMYVTSGGGAYMNFQAENMPGITWALEINFDMTGDIIGTSYNTAGNAVTPFTGDYTHDVWFELKLVINLSNNNWEVFIDGISQGSFSNDINQIASLDIFPFPNFDGFWIDDVCYTYTPSTLDANNGQVSNISPITGLTGQARYPSVQVRNVGLDTIHSFDITFDYNGTQITENISNINSGTGLLSLTTMQVDFSNSITLISGTNIGTATISNVNGSFQDDNPSDDVMTTQIVSITPASGKLVIGERATGTWNGWCPRGIVNENWMMNDFSEYYQAIAVHNGDPMTNTNYDSGLSANFFPTGLIDRDSGLIDPSDFEHYFLQSLLNPYFLIMLFLAQKNQLEVHQHPLNQS
mgnify:CR=1 FL=1